MSVDYDKTDRRVNRTRRSLRQALMELILERGYNTVRIEDITDRADMGRTTFYLHYKDKEELLVESLEAIAKDLKAQIERMEGESAGATRLSPHPVAVAFRHAEENRTLYRIILKGEGSSRAASRVREIIYAAAMELFTRRLSGMVADTPAGTPEIQLEVVSGYFASALLGFITWWLENDLPYSGDQAAEMFLALFMRGAGQVLHLAGEGVPADE